MLYFPKTHRLKEVAMSDHPTLEKQLVKSLLMDRKRDRRWRNIRFFIMISLIIFYASLLFSRPSQDVDEDNFNPKKPYVSFLELNGEITAEKSFSANRVIPELTRAFG